MHPSARRTAGSKLCLGRHLRRSDCRIPAQGASVGDQVHEVLLAAGRWPLPLALVVPVRVAVAST